MFQGGSGNPTSELDFKVVPVEVSNVHLNNISLGEEDLYQTSSAQDVITKKWDSTVLVHPERQPFYRPKLPAKDLSGSLEIERSLWAIPRLIFPSSKRDSSPLKRL